jgi:hypothetical protein
MFSGYAHLSINFKSGGVSATSLFGESMVARAV